MRNVITGHRHSVISSALTSQPCKYQLSLTRMENVSIVNMFGEA